LYYALREDRTPYSEFVDPGDERRGEDLRAVQRWLSRDFGVYDLIVDMPWPAHTPPSTVMPVLMRGREELQVMAQEVNGRRSAKVRG
jgi:hypothetical protein